MTERSPFIVRLLVAGLHVLLAAGAAEAIAQEAAPAGEASIRIEDPVDGTVLHTRQPRLRVCVTGGDEKTRTTLRAALDGEKITGEFVWSGECAEWTPHEGWILLGKRHRWSERAYDEDAWTSEMRDGEHTWEASVTDPSGGTVSVKSRFRVETEHDTASLGAGFPDISLSDFDGSFAPANLLEARFGEMRAWSLRRDREIVRYKDTFFSVGSTSSSLAENPDPGETETTLWRAALGKRKGYGYRTGDSGFIAPYHGTSGLLSYLDADLSSTAPADALVLEPFDGTTLVASAFEGGIAFGLGPSVTLDAGYEQTAVYPHFVVFEALGSGIVHGIALGTAEAISRQVARVSPRAAPIVSFVLRNGISYAIYHQRRKEVNWPFGGDPGLTYDGFKVSFTFTY